MKLAIFALLAGSAAAFQGPMTVSIGRKKAPKKAALKKAPAPKGPKKGPKGPPKLPAGIDLIGAIPPAGFFDPAGFAKKATPEKLARYRECEIMHGRFAQMATLGLIVPEKLAAGDNWGEDFLGPSNSALSVFEETPVLVGGTILLFSALETLRLIQTVPGDRVNAGIEGLGPRPDDPEEFLEYQLRELQNGRLAMLAFAGIIAQELVNGQDVWTTLDDIGIFSGKGLF